MNEMDPDLTHTRWRSKQTWSAAQSSDLMETFHCLPQLQTCFIHRNLKMWFWIHTHVCREQLSNVRLLFCTIKTQLNIHFTKVWYRFSESRKFKKVPEMQILCWWKLLWPRRAQTSAQLNTDSNPTWFFSPSLQTPGAQNDPKWTAAAERAPPAPPRCIQLT